MGTQGTAPPLKSMAMTTEPPSLPGLARMSFPVSEGWEGPGLLGPLTSIAVFLSGFCFIFPGSLDTSISQEVKNEGKGSKRKASDEEKNGSEELVEKKVCKGFQTV